MSAAYVPGQRFVSETEPELGLGRIERVESRSLVLRFPASDTVRRYAFASAPIRRVRFRSGDEIEDASGSRLRIEEVEEKGGLLFYRSGSLRVPETELSGRLVFSNPEERLLAGIWDRNRAFELRRRALEHRHSILRSEARGFLGARIELIPHQLYIAREVASRLRPRALLADEVGLGKTIEAGLVIHRLLRTGRASRVLILVPEPLVHQWFVEMFRRFHLSFTIADETYCREADRLPDENPFRLYQTIISSLEFVGRDEKRRAQIQDAGWDLMVVDEAHHVRKASPEYELVEAVAARAPGLLLLTATPEQLGEEGHFDRLRLLDPGRYPSYERYLEEAGKYRTIATMASKLIEGESLSPEEITLEKVLPRRARSLRTMLRKLASGDESARSPLLDSLVDQHGPGRVVFRNSRGVLAQFPDRKLVRWQLAWPPPARRASQFRQLAREFAADTSDPSSLEEFPYFFDVRVRWLADLLKDLAPEKVLVICRSKEKATALAEALRKTSRVSAALFHEGLSLLQRDRNAAWFAEGEDSAQVLLCSEIGSEGRNFQSAHHLALFDLPLSPELLEQRIGRLYRIGQEHTVSIHVPYLPGSAQEMLFLWLHEGLDAFERSFPGGVWYESAAQELRALALRHLENADPETAAVPPAELSTLVDETRRRREEVGRELETGRDRLLELSSFRPREAESLLAEIRRWDEDRALDSFIIDAMDELGVDLERIADRTFVFRQGAKLVVESLPGFRAEEVGMTSDRARATHQGELDFLTWDHPMVGGVLDHFLGQTRGSAALASLEGAPPGIFLEAIFVLEAVAPPELDVERFLPPTPVRVIVDENLEEVAPGPLRDSLAGRLRDDRTELRAGPALTLRMLKKARDLAALEVPQKLEAALAAMRETLARELARLRSLAELNDHVDPEEVANAEERIEKVAQALSSASLRLDALRVIRSSAESRSA